MRSAVKGLITGLALLLLWQLSHSYTVSKLQETQQRRQSSQLADLDRQLTQFSFIPKLLSGDMEIRQALVDTSKESIAAANKRLQRTQQESGLDVAFLLDRSGLTIASSNWSETLSFVGISYSFRPYFKNAVKGGSATFFAVGATTGIPGYFIAEPVTENSTVVGVVVAKVSLDVLVDAWDALLYDSLVVDEFGGVILSTREDLLYTPTAPMSEEQKIQLSKERRYELRAPALNMLESQSIMQARIEGQGGKTYFLFSEPLETEPWRLLSVIDEESTKTSALILAAAVASICLIAFLLMRLYQQQRKLVLTEQRTSQELEEKVLLRTEELERAQQRLISESNFAMLGRMSGAINHEINQPLASLRLNLASLRTMIEKRNADPQEIEEIVVDSDRTTKRIGRVISSLRSLARKNDSRFAPFDVARVVDDVVTTIKRERPAVSQYLRVSGSSSELRVLGDEVLIQQALLNLLYNAFDAVLKVESPTVELSVELLLPTEGDDVDDKQRVVIAVSDNGAGITDAMQETLFEPFVTTRQQNDGLGLGLTIARQIASDHGGELLYSGREKGSCFELHLPLTSAVNR